MITQDSTGSNIKTPTAYHLWEPKPKTSNTVAPRWTTPSPPQDYKLRISVLKDGEFQGDAPTRIYKFPSLHHLTHATNSLDNAFATHGSCVEIRKSGVETPISDVDLGHGIDGHLEDVRIEYTTTEEEDENGELREGEGWGHFLERLNGLEGVWESNVKGRI